MTLSFLHAFVSNRPDGPDPTFVQKTNWNAEHNAELTGPSLVGRTAATQGPATEIALGDGLGLSGDVLTLTTTRTFLTGDIDIYVRSDGNDSNDGLTDSTTGAFATWQAALNHVCRRFDFQGYTVTLKKGSGGSGTFSSGILFGYLTWVGGGEIVIDGGSSASCTLQTTAACIYLQGALPGVVSVKNIKLISSDDCIRHVGVGLISINDDVDFGGCGFAHIECHNSGAVVNLLLNSYKISGPAPVAHIWAHSCGAIYHESATVTLSNTPAFGAFAQSNTNGIIQSIGSTFLGTGATGLRYFTSTGGQIATFGGGANYFPGDVPGTADAATFSAYS